MPAAQFLLDSIEIRDNFGHSFSLLTFNQVCEIIVHLASYPVASLVFNSI